jgi:hypothetical protein
LTPTSAGEFITNAAATARHRRLLEAINSGQPISALAAPSLAGGLPVGGTRIHAPSLTNVTTNHINVSGGGGTDEQNHDLSRQIAQQIEDRMDQKWAEQARQHQRPGGMFYR